MRLGTLDWTPALHSPDLLAAPVLATLRTAVEQGGEHERAARAVLVTAIDPEMADTAAMTETYGLTLEISGNCVLVAGSRSGEERVAACVVRATTRADVNTTVRKRLDVRKASFLPMETAVADSGMAYGGITPLGLPERYRVMVDASLATDEHVIIGSGIRGSKLVLPGAALTLLSGAEVVEGLAR
ncbi:YbaK/EbsC family protein [Pseudactinotalea sp.]|uniref:YbaK/EbsC family protein n=1 Tax=Pseudactinotalea sp. TaxID=1926260 RepID=UPI003B3A3042